MVVVEIEVVAGMAVASIKVRWRLAVGPRRAVDGDAIGHEADQGTVRGRLCGEAVPLLYGGAVGAEVRGPPVSVRHGILVPRLTVIMVVALSE